MGRDGIILSSREEMVAFGKKLGESLFPGTILALFGDLGAGKTTFVQGLALGLQITCPIQSPTFVYLNCYEGKMPLFHFDLYRLKNEEDFLGLGFDEYFDGVGVCAIEWPERIASILPESVLKISIAHHKEGRLVFCDFF